MKKRVINVSQSSVILNVVRVGEVRLEVGENIVVDSLSRILNFDECKDELRVLDVAEIKEKVDLRAELVIEEKEEGKPVTVSVENISNEKVIKRGKRKK